MYDGKAIEGYAFMHRQRNRTTGRSSNQCFGFNAPGARWKHTMNYGISTTNTQGITSSLILTAIQNSFSTWNSILAQFTIFGNYDPSIIVDGIDLDAPDGKNEFEFGSIQDPGI
jgi:hypothetical protein